MHLLMLIISCVYPQGDPGNGGPIGQQGFPGHQVGLLSDNPYTCMQRKITGI